MEHLKNHLHPPNGWEDIRGIVYIEYMALPWRFSNPFQHLEKITYKDTKSKGQNLQMVNIFSLRRKIKDRVAQKLPFNSALTVLQLSFPPFNLSLSLALCRYIYLSLSIVLRSARAGH